MFTTILQIYFLIALIFFIINGLTYNLAIFEYEKEISLKITLRTALVYFVISWFWPVQLFVIFKLIYEETKNGKGN